MSGGGETGGTGGDVSRDEAAWRDLIARFNLPADTPLADAPWPAREDLPAAPHVNVDPAPPSRPASTAGPDLSGTADTVINPIITPDQIGGQPPGPSDVQPWARPGGSYGPADRTRVIRPAGDPRSISPPTGDPRSYSPPDADDDERYVPEPLPPPRLDPISKAALVGVIAGPGYLLIASVFLGWTISATAAFVAVAAFVAGFVTLVVKLGDRRDDDDDDDGAVL